MDLCNETNPTKWGGLCETAQELAHFLWAEPLASPDELCNHPAEDRVKPEAAAGGKGDRPERAPERIDVPLWRSGDGSLTTDSLSCLNQGTGRAGGPSLPPIWSRIPIRFEEIPLT